MNAIRWASVSVLAAAAVTVVTGGCATNSTEPATAAASAAPAAVEAAAAPNPWAGVTEAIAVVQSTSGSKVKGTVRFTQTADGVLVVADITGLKPDSRHAFHVHEFGDVSGGDGKTAGGHYNPEHHQHAGPDAPMHHAGDLGNMDADGHGNAHYQRTITGISIAGDHDPILGRAVVIHAGEDDLTSQPAGNAGDRIGCGVIGVAKPPETAAK